MSSQPLCDDVATRAAQWNVVFAYCRDSCAEQTSQLSRLPAEQTSQLSRLPSDSAKNGLDLYCKPVTLYRVLEERAKQNPSFLRRGLRYKIHAKKRKRIQITLSLSTNANAELQEQNIFPLYALFARSVSDVLVEGHSPLYQFNQTCLLKAFCESGRSNHTEATFTIPDLTTLATTQACSFDIILVSCGHVGQTLDEINYSEDYLEKSSHQKLEGKCFWGKIPVSLLRASLDNCEDLILGRTHKFASTIIMRPAFIEPNILEQDRRLIFCSRKFNNMGTYRLRVSIYAKEAGAKDIFNSPYSFYLYSNVPPSSLDLLRLRVGNVFFNYMNCNNICQTEVTEDFSCPFCLMKCGNFKGLEYHLLSSHDLFNFEFKVSEKEQAVNVVLKHHAWTDELFPDEAVDPRYGTFSYFSKYKKRGRLVAGTDIAPSESTVLSQTVEVVEQGQLVSIESESLEDAHAGFGDGYAQIDNDVLVAHDYSLHGGSLSPPKVLQFGRTRKLSVDQFDPKNRELLQKRQIFHSHNGQKMSFEEVLSDHDSEGEVDDDVVDLEERAVLDTYSDISEDDKRVMHMWNSFVRRQRVSADGHVKRACKAFSELHGQLFVQEPALRWCWRLFMIKLWKHNLLDGRTMDACNRIIDGFKHQGVKPS